MYHSSGKSAISAPIAAAWRQEASPLAWRSSFRGPQSAICNNPTRICILLCPFLEHRSSNMVKNMLGAGYGGARLWGGDTLWWEQGATRTTQNVSPAPLQMRRWHQMDGVVMQLRQ